MHGAQVSKAYLLLSKIYQGMAGPDMQRLSQQALRRSLDVIAACQHAQVHPDAAA